MELQENVPKRPPFSKGEKASVGLFIIAFSLYVINTLVGKAAIVWEWQVFHLGNVGEFLLLLAASVFIIIAALHRETVYAKAKREAKSTQGGNTS